MKLCRSSGAGGGDLRRPVARRLLSTVALTLVLAVAVVGSAPLDLEAAQPKRAITVRNDPGGSLSARVAQINQIRASGTQVRITGGYCNSACTMYLGLPQTCVSRNASFGFHGPMSQFFGVPLPPDQFEYWSQLMASYYPTPLRRWYLNKARYTTTGIEKVPGKTLIQMGVRECR